jgi:predicted Zn-dependent peptidase
LDKNENGFNISAIGNLYSDAGLLGAMVVCEASAAGKIVSAVAAALRSANVTEAEVAAAKKNLLADVYAIQGTAASLVEDIGTQVNSVIN